LPCVLTYDWWFTAAKSYKSQLPVLLMYFIHRYRGTYGGLVVAIKILIIENLNNTSEEEFLQEVFILRQAFS
jgi:hypothetical protein